MKASILKLETEAKEENKKLSEKEINRRLAKLMANTIISEEVIDVYGVLGLDNPDISILSDEFLQEVEKLKYKNLAVEMLRKVIEGKIHYTSRKNIVMAEKFSQRLQKSINAYRNKAISNFEVIEDMIKMAKDIMNSYKEGEELGLNEEEFAFYDALTCDKRAKELMGDETLIKIVRELADTIRRNITIDWENKESVQAKMRLSIRRLLKKYKYPPENTEDATNLVIEQAKLMCENELS